MKFIDKTRADEFRKQDAKSKLGIYVFDNQYILWALAKLGILDDDDKTYILDIIKSKQTKEGKLFSLDQQGKILRCLVLLEGNSNIVKNGINYFIKTSKDIEEIDSVHHFEDQLSGFISLAEYHYKSFENEIKAKKEELLDCQNENGSYYSVSVRNNRSPSGFRANRIAIEFLSRTIDPEHESIKKSIGYLQKQYQLLLENTTDNNLSPDELTDFLLSLVYAGKRNKKSDYHRN